MSRREVRRQLARNHANQMLARQVLEVLNKEEAKLQEQLIMIGRKGRRPQE